MKDRIILAVYIIFVLLLTSIHEIELFIYFLTILFLISYRDLFKLVKKTFLSIFLFNSVVSISYILISILQKQDWLEYITLLNIRVFSLTYLTFFVFSKINLFKALSFSKTLTYILTLSYSQILSFKRSYTDFKFALKSRTIEKPKLRTMYNHISALFYHFFNKSLKNSEDIAQAMKSRGFFND